MSSLRVRIAGVGVRLRLACGDGKRRIRFRRPDGRVIPHSHICRVADGDGLDQQHRTAGLVLDENTCKPRSLGDPLDYDIAVEGLLRRALEDPLDGT